ncbi:MAG: phage tail protein [Syntrophales bacterium]|jgi:hypothetical protein
MGAPLIFAVFMMAVAVGNAWVAADRAKNEQEAARKAGQQAADDARGQLLNVTSTQEPLKLIYGTTRVGINRAYVGTAGTKNNNLHIIGNLGEGESDSIYQITGVDQIFLDEKLWNTFADSAALPDGTIPGMTVHYEFFNGSASQLPCSTLNAAIPAWNEAKRYCTYIYVRLFYDENLYQGMPDVTVIVKGLKIYDPRIKSGVWMTGVQFAAGVQWDLSATAYSNNPALCARDFITRSSRRGGFGIPQSRLDDQSFIDAANYCDAKGWTCNLALQSATAAGIDSLTQILTTFRGAIVYSDGRFKCRYRDLNYESPVMSLTEADVVEMTESTLKIIQPSIFDTPNAVRVKFTNKDNKYQTDDYVVSDAVAIANDGDYREETVEILGIDNYPNAMKMGAYSLARFRINKEVSHQAGSRCMVLEAFDLIQLTHSIPGWNNKILRITSVSIDGDGLVALDYQEEDPSMYTDTYNASAHSWHDTVLPDPTSSAIPHVQNVTQAEEVYNYRGRSFTRWKINFDPPSSDVYPYWDYAEIWLQIGSDPWKFETTSRSGYVLDPVQEGQSYGCKMVSVSVFGSKEDFAGAQYVTKNITGLTGYPTAMTAITAIASGDGVSVFGNAISDPDVVGYELRLGMSWNSAVVVGTYLDPKINFKGVRPATLTWWIAPKNNAGRYALNPVSASCQVFYPANYTDKNTWSWDFTLGTFQNASHVIHNAQDALCVEHLDSGPTWGQINKWAQGSAWAAGVGFEPVGRWDGVNVSWNINAAYGATGIWTSPEYDLGSVKTVRVWGDFLMDFFNIANIWSALGPPSLKWTDIAAITKKWTDLFAGGAGGAQVTATIKWGNASGVYTGQADFFQLLAPEFTARYVQVIVTLTDPAAGGNVFLYKLNMKAAYWQ